MTRAQAKEIAASTLLIVAFFLAWEVVCVLFNVSEYVLPRPSKIFATLVARFSILWPHMLQTTYTTIVGFILGVVSGVVVGGLIGTSRLAYNTVYPLLIGFSSIPKVAIIPIFVIWFGIGTVPAVLTSLIICVFPIVVNVATGLATTDPEMEDVLKALGASKLEIFWNVGLPRTMPYLFASLKVAIAVSFIGSITAETIASNRGIGNVMLVATSNFDVPLVFAGLLLTAMIGVGFYAAFAVIERRVAGWAHRKDELVLA